MTGRGLSAIRLELRLGGQPFTHRVTAQDLSASLDVLSRLDVKALSREERRRDQTRLGEQFADAGRSQSRLGRAIQP